MKALNVLNESKRAICIFIDSFDEESKEDDEYTSSIKYLEEINEAIKELEELENRSCDSCKYFHQSYLCLELGKGNIQPKEIGLNYCNKWEAKK